MIKTLFFFYFTLFLHFSNCIDSIYFRNSHKKNSRYLATGTHDNDRYLATGTDDNDIYLIFDNNY